MPYRHIDFASGMFVDGTRYKNRETWFSGDRVRWFKKAIQPIGGWRRARSAIGAEFDQIATPPQAARAFLGWRRNDGSMVYVAGHNEGLKAWDRSGPAIADITPAGFTPRLPGVLAKDGYGDWFYGLDTYGTSRPVDTDTVSVFNWCLRTWGDQLLAAPRGGPSELYLWDNSLATVAAPVTGLNMPMDFDCFHVTQQRIVMTAGTALEPRLIQWSDSENLSDWAPEITNQAGNQILPGLGRFKEIVTVRDQVLLISETDVHAARYIGPPYIFSFDRIGENCGVIAGAAVTVTEDTAIWPSERGFFMYDGMIKELPCHLLDRLAPAFTGVNQGKIIGYINSDWNEAWWHYQEGAAETDSYVFYSVRENAWATGTLSRTGGGGHPNVGGPYLIGADGYLYQHELFGVVPSETGNAADIKLQSNHIEIGAGDLTAYVAAIMPDFKTNGAVDVFILGQDRPSGPEVEFGPYRCVYPSPTGQPVPARARGHTVKIKVQGASQNWALGTMRLDMKQGGRK